jgi:hypothetical protein
VIGSCKPRVAFAVAAVNADAAVGLAAGAPLPAAVAAEGETIAGADPFASTPMTGAAFVSIDGASVAV